MIYNKQAAQSIVKNIGKYEENVLQATRAIFSDAINTAGWKDKKHSDFCKELSSVLGDVKNGVSTIRAYKEHLSKRIQELG